MGTSYRDQFIPGGIGSLPEIFDSGRGSGFDYYIIRSDGVATATIDNVVGGGTRRVSWNDGAGNSGVDFYYPSGDLMMSSHSVNGGPAVYTTFDDVNGNSPSPVDNGWGRLWVENTLYSAEIQQGAVSSQSWFEVNGASGTIVTYADGTQTSRLHIMNEQWSYARDGSATRTEIYSRGSGAERYVETVTTEVNASGRLTEQEWTRYSEYTPSLNASGKIVHGEDGSRTETITRNGVISSVQSVDAQGNVTQSDYRSNGSLRQESYVNADNTRGMKEYHEGGGFTSYDFQANGSYLYTHDNGQGSVTQQWYTADNQPFDPNGSAGALADRQADALINSLAVFSQGEGADSVVSQVNEQPTVLYGAGVA